MNNTHFQKAPDRNHTSLTGVGDGRLPLPWRVIPSGEVPRTSPVTPPTSKNDGRRCIGVRSGKHAKRRREWIMACVPKASMVMFLFLRFSSRLAVDAAMLGSSACNHMQNIHVSTTDIHPRLPAFPRRREAKCDKGQELLM